MEDEYDVEGFIDVEMKSMKKQLSRYVNTDVKFVMPGIKQVKSDALFNPIVGATFSDYLDSVESTLFKTWDSSVRTGYLTGETTQQIVKNVLGSVSGSNKALLESGSVRKLRNSLVTNTRTVLQAFANESRNAFFKDNDKIFSGYRWLATLDLRTCVLCGSFEEKYRFTADVDDIPSIPVHPNCRCIVIPVIKSEFANLDYNGERASMDGPVGSKTTYSQWFDGQSEARQRDILGPSRFDLYKQGYKVKDFVSGNKIMTLKELADAE